MHLPEIFNHSTPWSPKQKPRGTSPTHSCAPHSPFAAPSTHTALIAANIAHRHDEGHKPLVATAVPDR